MLIQMRAGTTRDGQFPAKFTNVDVPGALKEICLQIRKYWLARDGSFVARMEEPLLSKRGDKNVLLKSPLTQTTIGPPPSKKLKQARLPFAPKQANSPPAPIAPKKRKLSDGSKNDKQPTKQAKSDEHVEKEVIVIEDNEVSSSSEAENAKNKHGVSGKPKKTIKDMFAFAQQSEVSTSSASPESSEIKMDAEDEKMAEETAEKEAKSSKNNNSEKAIVIDDDTSEKKTVSELKVKKVGREKTDSESEKTKKVEKEDDTKDSESSNSKSESSIKPADDEDSREDKENVSLLSLADDSMMEVSDVGDEDSGTEADTSVNDGTDAASSSMDKGNAGSSTPSGANRPKKPVMSEKKKAEREAAKQRKREELEKEKAAKMAERQKQKEERMKQKMEEKEKKEQEKQALKEKRMKEKQEKMSMKEKEKEEKNKVKEEEKKKKMEAVEAKMAEKKKIEDARKKKEDEKKQAEEEELMKKQKVKQAFMGFFKKPVDKPKSQQKSSGIFMEFEPKKDMRLAPVVRYSMPEVDKDSLDKEMQQQTCKSLYIDQLKSRELKPRRSGETWAWEYDDDLEIVDDEEEKPKPNRMKAKFLYFHQNYRPPYYGTWRKTSSSIRPRNPLGQDKVLLDYEVESDDEWEEEEPGESLSNSEGEEEEDNEPKNQDEDDDEDEDGFFVPHGYLSEGEGCEDDDDEDCTPERMKARQLAKAKAFEAEMKQKCQALRAFFIGCLWWTPEGSTDPNYKKLTEFTAVSLCSTGAIEVTPSGGKSSGSQDTSPSTSSKTKTPKEVGDSRGAMRKSVPEEAMTDLIRLVHGNRASIQKLIREFREYWSKKTTDQDNPEVSSTCIADVSQENVEAMDTSLKAMDTSLNTTLEGNTSICTPGTSEGKKCSISKRQLDITIRGIATYGKKEGFAMKCWYVSEEVLKKHNMTDLPVPTQWVWLTRTNIKPKEEEPATPSTPSGRDTPTQTSTPQPANSITKFTVPKSQLPSPKLEPLTPKSRDCTPTAPQTTTPKVGQEKLTPRNLMSIKSAFAAIPKAKPSPANSTKHKTPKDLITIDDDECMVIEDSPKKDPNPQVSSS